MSAMKKERFNQPMEFDQYLGHTDLAKHPDWKKVWTGDSHNKEAFDKILHDLGCDLNYGYEEAVCLHRPRTCNKPVTGLRVSFKERTDKWWVSNMMGIEDIARNTKGGLSAALARVGMLTSIGSDSILSEIIEVDEKE